MKKTLPAFIFVTLTAAMSMGFVRNVPGAPGDLSFERLHVFLFNLCAGGGLLIHMTEGRDRVRAPVVIFFAGAAIYAMCASLKWYGAAVIIALVLAALVELVRMRHFPVFPRDFFSREAPVAKKFHHAALLSLSIALVASALVIANNEFLGYLHYPRLKLDVFFLGFSFPVSLAVISVMFGQIPESASRGKRIRADLIFWTVNVGVIVFFLFILADMRIAQITMSFVLFAAVMLMFVMFIMEGRGSQERILIASGMSFIVLSGITGVAYVIYKICCSGETSVFGRYLLSLHSFISLYGWNLCGLLVILRDDEFPLAVNMPMLIAIHWAVVLILAPLGRHSAICGAAALCGFAFFLHRYLFSRRMETV